MTDCIPADAVRELRDDVAIYAAGRGDKEPNIYGFVRSLLDSLLRRAQPCDEDNSILAANLTWLSKQIYDLRQENERLREAARRLLATKLDQSIEWYLMVDNETLPDVERELYQGLAQLRTALAEDADG